MLGAIIGDIVGSAYEFNPTKRTDFTLFTEESNYTDDTVMTMAVYDAFCCRIEAQQSLESKLVEFANQFPCPKGGYGGKFRKWLFHPEELPPYDGSRQPYNSWGNGSAMRVSSVGWMNNTIEEVERMAEKSASVSHNHPEGIKGAQATAVAILLARQSMTKEEIRNVIEQRYGYNLHRTVDEIRPDYKFDESCQRTVPEAIICFLESTDYESAIRLAVSLGGDSDTLACITGGIAEAYYRYIPENLKEEAYKRLPEIFKDMLNDFYEEAKEKDRWLDNINKANRERIETLWKLDEFYSKIAKEEGSTFTPKTKELHLAEFPVAGVSFCKKFTKQDKDFVKEGMTLILKREDNPHDKNAIALYIDDIKVGYVPKAVNPVPARMMDAGKLLICRVIDADYTDMGWERVNAALSMIEL